MLYLYEGDCFRCAAQHNVPPAMAEHRRLHPVFRPGPRTGLGRVAATKRTAHISDVTAEQAYIEGDPTLVMGVKLGGYRTVLSVPMLKENRLVGAINIYRQQAQAFTDKQIELVSNFASQAVIAIENVRLLNELRHRTDDLSEALEQQTATSEVLQVISSSPGELEPVFQAMLENAVRTCDAKFGTLYLREADAFRMVATHNAPPAYVEARDREPFRPPPSTPLGRAASTRQVVQIADIRTTQAYTEGFRPIVEAVELGGFRTVLSVPMLKENELIGVINILRQEVRPFSDKQIELIKNFANQAVIAIENTRLLNELRESLQQQTATADVLKVISRSAFDLPTVLNTLVESAAQLCEGDKAQILRPTGKDASYYSAASYGHTPEFNELARGQTYAPGRGGVVGRVLLERKSVQIPEIRLPPLRENWRLSHNPRSAAPARGGPHWRARHAPHRRPPVHREADRAGRDLRRPGGDSHRERAAIRRGASAHARADRGAAAADGDFGGPASHQQFSRPTGAGVPSDAGKCDAHLRGQVRYAIPLRRRRFPSRRDA